MVSVGQIVAKIGDHLEVKAIIYSKWLHLESHILSFSSPRITLVYIKYLVALIYLEEIRYNNATKY